VLKPSDRAILSANFLLLGAAVVLTPQYMIYGIPEKSTLMWVLHYVVCILTMCKIQLTMSPFMIPGETLAVWPHMMCWRTAVNFLSQVWLLTAVLTAFMRPLPFLVIDLVVIATNCLLQIAVFSIPNNR
jgi:hypothetical protein